MFSIDDRNKIKLTKGDTASMCVTIEDLDGDEYEASENDSLVLKIWAAESDTNLLEKTAGYGEDGNYYIVFNSSDTSGVTPTVYNYDIKLTVDGKPFTIIDESVFEILGGSN